MPVLESPALKDAVGVLNERRKTLHDIFAEAGPEMDMAKVKSLDGDSQAKVDAIRTLTEEIDANQKKVDDLTALVKGASEAGRWTEDGPIDPERPVKTVKSVGERITECGTLTVKGAHEIEGVDLKAVLTTATGFAPDIVRSDVIVPFATRPAAGLFDILPMTTTTQAAVTWMEETTFTNAAAETAEGVAKPEATLVFTERTSTVRKIPVLLPVTDEQLADVPRLTQYLDNRLGFMVRQRATGQVISGNGTAPNLRGFLNVAGIQTQAKGPDPTPDAVYKAMVLGMTTGQAMPDAVVFNPLDWQDVRLLRTVDGIYIWGNPSEGGPERIWGLPVILDQAMTLNTALVGAFREFSEFAVRQALTVETGYNLDDWAKNQQTIRAEMRGALVVYRPAAFVTVTGI
jgi:HK97 family phage major capsid protein